MALACTTATFVVQQYAGDPLPAHKIAILRITGGGDEYIAALDGEGLGFQLDDPRDRVHVEMLPGTHEISIGINGDDRVVTRLFEARGGKVYRAVVLRNRLQRDNWGRLTWTLGVFEVDGGSDELLSDVSRDPEAVPAKPTALPPSLSPPAAPSVTAVPSSSAGPVDTAPVDTAPVDTAPVDTAATATSAPPATAASAQTSPESTVPAPTVPAPTQSAAPAGTTR
jgi:hypothetical protein